MAVAGSVGVDEESRLFAELYPSLRRFAAVVGPVEVDPNDLVQEAVAQLLARRRLTDLDNPGAYLRRAIVHLASNHRRRLAIRRRALPRLVGDATSTVDAYPSDLAELGRLSPGDRAVLYLTAVEGRSYAEVGRLLGCSEATARKRGSRARHRLYVELAGEVA